MVGKEILGSAGIRQIQTLCKGIIIVDTIALLQPPAGWILTKGRFLEYLQVRFMMPTCDLILLQNL
jgi:hypothetical protein